MTGPLRLPGSEDTIAALATALGRGALAVLRMSGPGAYAVAERVLDPWRPAPRVAYRAALRDAETGRLVDRPVVTVYRGPRSYTGEDLVELSVHGGQVGPARALAVLLAAGARTALPGEFTRRAVLAGKLDLLQAEAIGDLIDAESRAMHDVALGQLDGRLSRYVAELREAVLQLEAMIAYEIDFPEEDSGPIAPVRIAEAADDLVAALDRLLGTVTTGEVVRRGARVVLAGAPNAGKSSLFNALVGQDRAIVTEFAGTTRDAIEAVIEVGGWPVRLVDTAGLRASLDPIEQLGVAVAARALGEADVVLACADDGAGVQAAVDACRAHTAAPVVALRTKADLVAECHEYARAADAGAGAARGAEPGAPIPVSARTGAGLVALGAVLQRLIATRVGPNAAEGTLPVLTRERHRAAIDVARHEMAAFQSARRDDAVPMVVAAVHLRATAAALDSLIGVVDVDDVLDRVFRTFCVGK